MEMGKDHLSLASEKPKKRAGRKVFKETRHPIFRGVRKRNNNKWVCEVREPIHQHRIWLGTFPTPEMAARAHDVAALALRGMSACLNFADSTSVFKPPDSLNPEDIRKAATEVAELFRPQENPQITVYDNWDQSMASTSGKNKGNNMNEMVFLDEEEVFDMPRVMMSMAEGMLLSPPRFIDTDLEKNWWDDDFGEVDMQLWSHSA